MNSSWCEALVCTLNGYLCYFCYALKVKTSTSVGMSFNGVSESTDYGVDQKGNLRLSGTEIE